jgi:hypothetical protein
MYQKRPGVFMADWWDADGRRHRKQFANSAAAREHEHRETALAHAERASREMKLAARTSSVKKSASKTATGTIEPAKGKLGVMIPGMGAVATTFVAGVEAIRKGIAKPIGSLTQMGTVRLGKRTDGRSPKVKEFVPLATLDDLVFTGWDIFKDNMYEAASNAGVLDYRLLEQLKPFLSSITPRAAVFDHNYVKKIDGPNVKKGKTKMDLAEQLRDDIRDFRKTSGASRLITMWCGSTESYIEPTEAHQSVKSFEKALKENDEMIAPSMSRQRRAQPDRRPAGDAGAFAQERSSDLRQGFQDWPDPDEDGSRARVQSPASWPERMVFHQHPRQPGRRSARRSRVV